MPRVQVPGVEGSQLSDKEGGYDFGFLHIKVEPGGGLRNCEITSSKQCQEALPPLSQLRQLEINPFPSHNVQV